MFLQAIFSMRFLPRDATPEHGIAMARCPSICNVQVSWSYRLEFLENNFTAD